MHFYFYFLLKLNRNTEKSRVVTNFQGLKFTHNLLLPVTKIFFVLVVTAFSYSKSCRCTTILSYSKSCPGITLTRSSKNDGTGCLFFYWFRLNFASTKILYNLWASFNGIWDSLQIQGGPVKKRHPVGTNLLIVLMYGS